MTIVKVCLRAGSLAVFMLFTACAFAQTEINPDQYDVFVNPQTAVQKPSPKKLTAVSRPRDATAPKVVSSSVRNNSHGGNVPDAGGQAALNTPNTPGNYSTRLQTKPATQKKLVASSKKHGGTQGVRSYPGLENSRNEPKIVR